MRAELAALDAELVRLHGRGPPARLAALHRAAAEALAGDALGHRFHLTHAYVHALEAGDWAGAEELAGRLRAVGAL